MDSREVPVLIQAMAEHIDRLAHARNEMLALLAEARQAYSETQTHRNASIEELKRIVSTLEGECKSRLERQDEDLKAHRREREDDLAKLVDMRATELADLESRTRSEMQRAVHTEREKFADALREHLDTFEARFGTLSSSMSELVAQEPQLRMAMQRADAEWNVLISDARNRLDDVVRKAFEQTGESAAKVVDEKLAPLRQKIAEFEASRNNNNMLLHGMLSNVHQQEERVERALESTRKTIDARVETVEATLRKAAEALPEMRATTEHLERRIGALENEQRELRNAIEQLRAERRLELEASRSRKSWAR